MFSFLVPKIKTNRYSHHQLEGWIFGFTPLKQHPDITVRRRKFLCKSIFYKHHKCACLIALLITTLPSFAQVHRCVTAAGKIEFSDSPCKAGASGGQVDVKPNVLDTSEARSQYLRDENQRLRDELAESRQTRNTQPIIGRTEADLQSERADTLECKKSKRDLAVAASSIDKRRTTLAEERAMYSACGMRAPEKATQSERKLIRNCDDGGCWDFDGTRYRGLWSSGFLRGPDGRCRILGGFIKCEKN